MSLLKYAPLAMIGLASFGAHAESNKIVAQYWIDVSTSSMSIPGMTDQGGMMGGFLNNAMSSAMGGMQGKTVNTELWVRGKPEGVEATHAIPEAMNMGASLPLVPIKPVKSTPGTYEPTERSDSTPEKPKGRILIYWGCGDEIRKGQPKIFDFSNPNYMEYAQFFASRGGRQSKGVQGKPGDSVWPNERDHKKVPDNASLQGAHAVTGDGVPASLKFNVDTAYDFLPKARLTTKGDPKSAPIVVNWNEMEFAKGYFLQAQGAAKGDDGGTDMIMWSSSETPDAGWSLMSYQVPSEVEKLVKKKVVLSDMTSTCTIPKGVFEKADGAMMNFIAYGPEFNASYPARPPKAPKDWQPDWTARIRVKSTGMTMLGMKGGSDEQRSSRRRARDDDEQSQQDEEPAKTTPGKVLRGLLGF